MELLWQLQIVYDIGKMFICLFVCLTFKRAEKPFYNNWYIALQYNIWQVQRYIKIN